MIPVSNGILVWIFLMAMGMEGLIAYTFREKGVYRIILLLISFMSFWFASSMVSFPMYMYDVATGEYKKVVQPLGLYSPIPKAFSYVCIALLFWELIVWGYDLSRRSE